jgi:hypothetical protein
MFGCGIGRRFGTCGPLLRAGFVGGHHRLDLRLLIGRGFAPVHAGFLLRDRALAGAVAPASGDGADAEPGDQGGGDQMISIDLDYVLLS